ncbi:MAG TPA: NAD(P)-dependent alcohol dehydrogenase [Ktedonobacteraceae bacterium]|nr:NAD(P)-dependent alcohol dehydrogenase [Ktedonobacteraceae bacterium]
MTQTNVKTTQAGQFQADREAFPVASGDTMKAIVYTHYGSPDVLQLKEVAKPTPQDHEVLVHVHAVSVNAADWHLLRGKPLLMRLMGYGFLKPKHTILGAAMAGRVEAVGRNATQFQSGDEIFGDLTKSGFGAFAEYVCAREDALALKPANVTFEQAAAVPLAAVTALQGLRAKGQIQLGQQVLIHGASGGVGTFAVQIAKAFGAQVTAVCSTRNVDLVRSLGADQVIDYTQEDFTKNGQRYDFIFAVNGYHSIFDYKRALNPKGVYVMIGGSMAAMVQAMLLGPVMSMTGRQKMGSMGVAKPNQKDLVFMKELLEAGKVKPVIDRRYPFGETAAALRYLEKGHAQGKVVITMA